MTPEEAFAIIDKEDWIPERRTQKKLKEMNPWPGLMQVS